MTHANTMNPKDQFISIVQAGILSLPQDLKSALRVVEDADVEEADRVKVAGVVLHVLSGSNAIPGMRGILAHVGDVLLLRVILKRVSETSAEAMKVHFEEAPELFGDLDESLRAARTYLGELMQVIERVADGVERANHQGHSASDCAGDTAMATWLYDAVSEATVERLEFDEEEVVREARQVDRILPHLKTRLGR